MLAAPRGGFLVLFFNFRDGMGRVDCLNCGTPLTGRHCTHCGQPAAVARLGRRDLVQPLAGLLDADRGWLHTAAELSRRPGAMIRAYLAGRRVAYTEPLKYTMIAVALALFALWLAPAPAAPAQAQTEAALQSQAREIIERYGNALLLMTVPFMAGASRLLFRREGLNLTEHIVLNAYVFAQQNLISLPFLTVGAWWPAVHGPTMSLYYGVIIAYYAWVLRGVVARTWWGAMLGALGITAVAYVLFWVVFTVVLLLVAKG